MFELKEFQKKAINNIISLIDNKQQKIVMQSPTGSGKTIILSKMIEEYFLSNNQKTAFIWFTPGNGELEEQSKSKFMYFVPKYKAKNLNDAIRQGINDKEVVFINWELINKKDNKALREQEKKNLLDRIEECNNKNINFIIIVDESHTNITDKTRNVISYFGTCPKIYVSATIDKKKMPKIDIEITDEEVIRSGLITKFININEGISKKTNISINEEEILIDLAIKKQKEIKKEYELLNKNINPLIIIQYPNENTKNNRLANSSGELMDRVNDYLKQYGYTYENKSIGCWLDGNKINIDIDNDNQPLSSVIFLHVKQALATGWDCPRAKILVKLRDNMNESFEIQTLGRIRRMPEQCHYENNILDNCYLYTFDEKYKEKAISEYGGKETKILYLKNEYEYPKLNLGLKKQVKSIVTNEQDDKEKKKIVYNYFVKKYNLEEINMTQKDKSGYLRNKKKLEKINEQDGFIFSNKIEISTREGKVSSTKNLLNKNNFNEVIIEQNTLNYIVNRKYNDVIWIIAKATSLQDNIVRTILQELFLGERTNPRKKRNSIGRVYGLKKREFRIFVINNKEQIIKDINEARYKETYQTTMELKDIKELDFYIPQKDIVYLNPSSKSIDELKTNVYEEYTKNINRSTPEKRFEEYCEQKKVEWIYKNGDKGQNYLSIVYQDNYEKDNLFYPDYIVKANGEIYIIETKGGLWDNEISKNIDKNKVDKKLLCLKSYVENHNSKYPNNKINWAFVKDVDTTNDLGDTTHTLYYTQTIWTEDLDEKVWKNLSDLF